MWSSSKPSTLGGRPSSPSPGWPESSGLGGPTGVVPASCGATPAPQQEGGTSHSPLAGPLPAAPFAELRWATTTGQVWGLGGLLRGVVPP